MPDQLRFYSPSFGSQGEPLLCRFSIRSLAVVLSVCSELKVQVFCALQVFCAYFWHGDMVGWSGSCYLGWLQQGVGHLGQIKPSFYFDWHIVLILIAKNLEKRLNIQQGAENSNCLLLNPSRKKEQQFSNLKSDLTRVKLAAFTRLSCYEFWHLTSFLVLAFFHQFFYCPFLLDPLEAYTTSVILLSLLCDRLGRGDLYHCNCWPLFATFSTVFSVWGLYFWREKVEN